MSSSKRRNILCSVYNFVCTCTHMLVCLVYRHKIYFCLSTLFLQSTCTCLIFFTHKNVSFSHYFFNVIIFSKKTPVNTHLYVHTQMTHKLYNTSQHRIHTKNSLKIFISCRGRCWLAWNYTNYSSVLITFTKESHMCASRCFPCVLFILI